MSGRQKRSLALRSVGIFLTFLLRATGADHVQVMGISYSEFNMA